MADMDMNGMNFTGTGALMNQEEMIAMRKKKGQCVTCGRQTHTKKMFKMVPINLPGEVLEGRCLRCRPLSDRLSASMSGGASTAISRSGNSTSREASAAAFYEQFNAQLGSNAPNPVLCSNGQVMAVPGGSGIEHMEQYPSIASAGSGGGPSPRKPTTRFKAVTKQLMHANRLNNAIPQQQDNNHHQHQHHQYHDDDRSVYSTQSYDQTRSSRGGNRGSSRYNAVLESSQSLVSQREVGNTSNSVRSTSKRHAQHPTTSQSSPQRPLSPRSQMREMALRRDYSRRRASMDDHEVDEYYSNSQKSSSSQRNSGRRHSSEVERGYDNDTPESNRSVPSRQNSGRSQRSDRSGSGFGTQQQQQRQHQSMYVENNHHVLPSTDIDNGKSMDLRGFLDRGGVIDRERFNSARSTGGGGGSSSRRSNRGSGRVVSSSRSYAGPSPGGGGGGNGSDRSLRSNPTPPSASLSSPYRSNPSHTRLSQIESSGDIYTGSLIFDDRTPPREKQHDPERSRDSSYYEEGTYATRGGSVTYPSSSNHRHDASFQNSELSDRKIAASIASASHHSRYTSNSSSRLRNDSTNSNHYRDSNPVFDQSMSLDEITGSGTGALGRGNGAQTSLSVSQAMKVISRTTNALDVLDLMREFASISRDIQVEGCHFFSRVADSSSSSVRSAFFQLGGCDCIITAMRNYPNDEALQEEACTVMEVYSRNCVLDGSSSKILAEESIRGGDSNTDIATEQPSLTFVQFGAVEWVAAAMKQFSQNVKLQTPAMAALANFSSSELLRSDIQECRCIPTIVSVMTTHCLDDQLQEVATACLANLSSSDSSFKKIISSSGGIDAICIAMVMHPNSVKLQQVGCRALRFLSASNEENKTKIESAGGIDSILSSMLIHQSLAGVVVEGLWALSNLAINKHNKIVIGESNGVEVIVKTMWAHGGVADVQELACRTLWTLSVNADNKARVANQGGIKAIVNAMQAHSDHAGVQQNGCGCLANLAANSDSNKRLIVEGEGVDAVVMAMMLHGSDKVVQERAVNCVRKLTFEPHLEALRAAGVAALVEQAAQSFPSQCRAKADQVLGIL